MERSHQNLLIMNQELKKIDQDARQMRVMIRWIFLSPRKLSLLLFTLNENNEMNLFSSLCVFIVLGNAQRTPNFKKQNDQKQDSSVDYGDNEVIFIFIFWIQPFHNISISVSGITHHSIKKIVQFCRPVMITKIYLNLKMKGIFILLQKHMKIQLQSHQVEKRCFTF